jgi:ubiquinone/menaquinone biosynthesis C-methylase UbiE
MKKSSDSTEVASRTADFYEKEAADYDRKRAGTGVGAYSGSVSEEIVSGLISALSGKTVLEMGTGTGRWTTLLAQREAAVAGLDISHSMLLVAREKLRRAGLDGNVFLLQGDGRALPMRDDSCDGVVSINVFTHIPDHAATIGEIARVLKPGGLLIGNYLNVLSYYLPYGLLVNVFKKSLRAGVFTRWHTLNSLKADYASAGLSIQEVIGQVHFPGSSDSALLASLLRFLDKSSRSSSLRYLAPILYLKAVKL